MKVAISVITILAISCLLAIGGLYAIGSYKLKSEISVNQYVDVLDVQHVAPYAINDAMEDGVITYSEYYNILEEAKQNTLMVAKVKIVLNNPIGKEKSVKSFTLEPRGTIKLEEKEGLLND